MKVYHHTFLKKILILNLFTQKVRFHEINSHVIYKILIKKNINIKIFRAQSIVKYLQENKKKWL